ncbi:MAG TPA: hypothetical protein VF517_04215, partial [Thermoleophilaceae bacterium]
LGIVIWLLFPAKGDSKWKLVGPFPWSRGSGLTLAEARAQLAEGGDGKTAAAKPAARDDGPPAEPPHVSP